MKNNDLDFLNVISNKSELSSEEYSFIKSNPFLGNRIMLLAYGGSIAYGTNLPTSDVDIRGIAINPLNEIFGLRKDFEQVVDTVTDTTIYSLIKMNMLLLKCNPNVVEILGCKPEHYLYVNPYGKLILDNGQNYLSMAAIDSFGGYARAQFNRLEHGLLGNGANEDKKLSMLKHSLDCTLEAFNIKHASTNAKIKLSLIKTLGEMNEFGVQEEKEEIVLSGKFSNYPIKEIKTILSEFHKVDSEYGNINKRNTKKTDMKLSKHMMHLVRLYLMATELNKYCRIKTNWDGEKQKMLMSIRSNDFLFDNGMRVRPEFYELLHSIQEEYEYSVKYTCLPELPNLEALQEMMVAIYGDYLSKV